MTVLENQDRWETSNVTVVSGRVTQYEKTASARTFRFLEYGMLASRLADFDRPPTKEPFDLATVMQLLTTRSRVLVLRIKTRFYDIENEQLTRATATFDQRLATL